MSSCGASDLMEDIQENVNLSGVKASDISAEGTILNEDKILAFVGKKIAVIRVSKPWTSTEVKGETEAEDEVIVVGGSTVYLSRYRILDVIHGSFNGNLIEFKAYDHYGFPSYSKEKFVLLYVYEENGILYRKADATIHPTKNGRWAFCGDPYSDDEDNENYLAEKRPLDIIEFWPPVIEKLSEYSDPEEYDQDEIGKWFVKPIFEIKGGKATCKMGVYAEEMYRIQNEEYIKPEKRSELCEEKIKLVGNDYKNRNKLVSQCMLDLKARDWP